MEPRVSSAVVRGDEVAWRALPVPGIAIKVLRDDKETGESTVLLRFEAAARLPAPDHPGGEQVFVLGGERQIGRDRLRAGDYLYTPPNGTHALSAGGGCLLLATLPKPIEILDA